MRCWFRLRWWFARKVCPKGVHALKVEASSESSQYVRFRGAPGREWGYGHRYVPESVVRVLKELERREKQGPWKEAP